MKPIFKILMLLFLFTGAMHMSAQQGNLFNTYVYDPMQLNMAYAGVPCSEANLHYRRQWIGLKDAPVLVQINAHTAFGQSNGVGLRIASQQSGLLNRLQATIGYAYSITLSRTSTIHFGLGVGMIQNSLGTQQATVIDAGDLTLSTGSKQKASGFDSELGAMFIGDKLKAGVGVQHLYASNANFAGSAYKTLPQLNTSASYIFNKGKNVEVEPWLLDIYTIKGNNAIEGLLNFNFMQTITAGAGYRSNYGLLFFVGVKAGSFKAGYSFDYGTSANKTITGSSHQVLVGFSSCKAKAKNKRYKSRGKKIRSRF